MHLFHSWGKWEDAEAEWIVPFSSRTYTTAVQVKDCKKCGKSKVRKLTYN